MGFSLDDFKREFEVLVKKHKLPSFDEINADFEIDKIDRETFAALRLVRKVMMEKIVNSVSFLELLMNPQNTPRMYYGYMRTMTAEDKKQIDSLYNELSKLSISSLMLEVDPHEKSEAEMIRLVYDTWQKLKPGFKNILGHMKKPINGNGDGVRKEKSYFG